MNRVQERTIVEADFRPIQLLSWNDLIGGVRYLFEVSGIIYQLAPYASSSWDIFTLSSDNVSSKRGSAPRSRIPSFVPPVDFCGDFYLQYPARCYSGKIQTAMSVSDFVANSDVCITSSEIENAVNRRHPGDTAAAKAVIESRVSAELRSYKERDFFSAVFAPARDMEMTADRAFAQGNSLDGRAWRDQAVEIRRQIQARLDSGTLKFGMPETDVASILNAVAGVQLAESGNAARAAQLYMNEARGRTFAVKPREPAKRRNAPEEITPPGRRMIILEDED